MNERWVEIYLAVRHSKTFATDLLDREKVTAYNFIPFSVYTKVRKGGDMVARLNSVWEGENGAAKERNEQFINAVRQVLVYLEPER